MEPIHELIEELATADDLPHLAVAQCQLRFAEAAPPLRAVLERAAGGEALSEAEENLLFVGLHILGAGRDTQAFQPLLRLLRRDPDELEWLLGDATTETLPRIVAGVFDGDAGALFAAIADRGVDAFVRLGLLGAATFLTWEGRIERERYVRFLERFDEERLADEDDPAWIGWQDAIALLGLRSHVPRVERAWQDGRLSEPDADFRYFVKDLARAERAPDDVKRFRDANLGYIEDSLEALERFTYRRGGGDGRGSGQSDPVWPGDMLAISQPVTNPWRHVGRNDPCPCGSGKKAKKCCLAA